MRTRRILLFTVCAFGGLAACVPGQSGPGGSSGGRRGNWVINEAKNGEWVEISPDIFDKTKTMTTTRHRAVTGNGKPGFILYVEKAFSPDKVENDRYQAKWGTFAWSQTNPPKPGSPGFLDTPPDKDAKIYPDLLVTPADEEQARKLFKAAFDLYQAGDFQAAAKGFEEGFEYDTRDAAAHFYAAEADYRIQQYVAAAANYAYAAAAAPTSAEGIKAKAILQSFFWDEHQNLKPEILAAIEANCIGGYSVTDKLNHHKNCGFPSGKPYFDLDVMEIHADADQRTELDRAWKQDVVTYDWKADCQGFYEGSLSPKIGTAGIPWWPAIEVNCPFKLYYLNDLEFDVANKDPA